MKLKNKMLTAVLAAFTAMLFSVQAYAYNDTAIDSYLYFNEKLITAAPAAFEFSKELTAESMAMANGTVTDIKYRDGRLYVLDGSGGRIAVLNDDGKLIKVIENTAGLNNPGGIFVSSNNEIYIADTDNARIVKLNADGAVISVIGAPDKALTLSETDYAPLKVAADAAGRLYVLSKDETNGIFQLGQNGDFYGFYGSVPVVPGFKELFWRKFSTKEQLSRMLLFIPTEYSGMDIDENGFVYVTVSTNTDSEMRSFLSSKSSQIAPIRRLNPKGSDVMLRNGDIPPMGDAVFEESKNEANNSSKLTEITVAGNGIYSVLDTTRSRIFTYDSDGNMLYEFGKKGSERADLAIPKALCAMTGKTAVIDQASNSVKIYTETEYAKTVNAAVIAEKNGNYDAAGKHWNKVLDMCAGCNIALKGKARQALRERDYKAAMAYFKRADDRKGCSKAFSLYRKQAGFKLTAPAIIAVLTAAAVFAVCKKLFKRKARVKKPSKIRDLLEKIKYGFYIMRHPFDGFWDMGFENQGSMGGATAVLVLVVIFNTLSVTFSGYILNGSAEPGDNLLIRGILGILLPVGLWCAANWSVTSLMNGSGSLKKIYMYTCYSLTPLLFGLPVLLIFSRFISLDEMALYTILQMLMYVWMAFLIFAGTTVVHQYSAGKAVFTIFIIFAAIGVILFLFLLCMTIIQQMTDFVRNIAEEISLRS